MKCSLCGFNFNEEKAEAGCAGCGLIKKCGLIKCPNCGFETPVEPKWLKNRRKRKGPQK